LEYIVLNKYDYVFCGFEEAEVRWSNDVLKAKPLYDINQFNFFKRWFNHLNPEMLIIKK
jgi:hypothetical protein